MQSDVYTILCFSEMSLPRSDIYPDLIVLIAPHEQSVDPITIIFEFTLQAITPRTFVDGKECF